MCGITAIVYSRQTEAELRHTALKLSKRIRHRGPDWNGIKTFDWGNAGCTCVAHERLAIVDPLSGKQPLFGSTTEVACTVNGEIYNHEEIKEKWLKEEQEMFTSHSDCQVIPFMFEKYGINFVNELDGMFAFVVVDSKTRTVFAARDPIGICPLYIGYSSDGGIMFSSEMKVLVDHCVNFEVFLPGHYYYMETGKKPVYEKYFDPVWLSLKQPVASNDLDLSLIREGLTKAVRKRLMGDVPFGVLLSGGLDSSLVASIAKKEFDLLSDEKKIMTQAKVMSFSVGLKGSPDLAAARQAAEYIGTKHNEFIFSLEEGIDAVHDVIYHLETYDVTTIRSAVPLYFLSRFIRSLGIKVVLSGEGADEVFGGYLYFHKAPNSTEFHRECQRKVSALHLYDVLRANKSGLSWGVEIRVPFLDLDFLRDSMSLDAKHKMCTKDRMEKWCLRRAFDDGTYLPDKILWRQKEQFSDGVGYSWIDGLKLKAEEVITDQQMTNASTVFKVNTPKTKEAYMFRSIFNNLFPSSAADLTIPGGPSIACSSSTAVEWDESFKKNADQSGRAVLGVHRSSTQFLDAKQ